MPVIPTPFTERQDVDYDALEGLLEFAVRAGAGAVCLPAYGSEFYKLSEGERGELVRRAALTLKGRVPLMAQSNHPGARHAAVIAARNEALGAEIISFALPRQFALPEETLLRYAGQICGAVAAPVLIQDFNPGGASVGASFARRLFDAAPNFRYLKLEQPQMGPLVRAVREATDDCVSVLEGWGGMYLPELIPYGIAGAMPGLPMCDLFVRIWNLAAAGAIAEALEIHTAILPQIVYSLQNMELFHHAEKRLLAARGLLQSTVVRDPAAPVDGEMPAYMEILQAKVLRELRRHGLT